MCSAPLPDAGRDAADEKTHIADLRGTRHGHRGGWHLLGSRRAFAIVASLIAIRGNARPRSSAVVSFRFASRRPLECERRGVRGFVPLDRRASESGLDGRIQRASTRILPRDAGGPRLNIWVTRHECPRRAGLPAAQTPAHPAARCTLAGRQIQGTFFKWGFGIDGPSRPRRCPRPGETHADGLDANVAPRAVAPSRDRQGTTPSRRAAWMSAPRQTRRQGKVKPRSATRCGSSGSRRSAGRLAQSSRQARCSARALAAGIVAASMARRCPGPL